MYANRVKKWRTAAGNKTDGILGIDEPLAHGSLLWACFEVALQAPRDFVDVLALSRAQATGLVINTLKLIPSSSVLFSVLEALLCLQPILSACTLTRLAMNMRASALLAANKHQAQPACIREEILWDG
jgi:hypothetical protein